MFNKNYIAFWGCLGIAVQYSIAQETLWWGLWIVMALGNGIISALKD